MPKTKYFEGIEQAQREGEQAEDVVSARFDLRSLATGGLKTKISAIAFKALIGPIYGISRRFFPIFKAAGFYHVTRDADVRSILNQPLAFTVPFGREMEELVGGAVFALGMDGPAQQRQNQLVRQIIKAEDGALIAKLTRDFAEGLLDNCAGKIDVVDDLIKRSVAESCIRYFGLYVEDSSLFADWMIACSMFLFGDPYGDPKIREQALAGAHHLRVHFDNAIRRAQQNVKGSGSEPSDTFVSRLVSLQKSAPVTDPISDAEIRAILFGVLTGFVPTNTLAAGKMLDELLQRPSAWQSAVEAARDGDAGKAKLRQILLEAGRLSPAISPGVWRFCKDGANVGGKKIEPGSILLVSTMSALRDERAIPSAKRFWPERVDANGRPVDPDLMFGAGVHECIGKYLSMDQITEIFAALLSRPGLSTVKGRAGKLQSIGPYPRHLTMSFDTPAAQQSMFLIIAPVTSGESKDGVDRDLATLGHPAGAAARAAFDATGIVHFSSIATILSDHRLDLVVELSVDGGVDRAIATLADHCDDVLRKAFKHCGLGADGDLHAFLKKHVVELEGKHWSKAVGLNYNGLGEFPVATVDRQARFAAFAEKAIADYLATEAAKGSHPMRLLTHVRRLLRGDNILASAATPNQKALMEEARREGFDAMSMVPAANGLKLAEYVPPTYMQAFGKFLASRDGMLLAAPVIISTLLFGFAFNRMFPGAIATTWAEGALRWVGVALGAVTLGLMTIAGLFWAFFAAIRRAEKKDWIDEEGAPLDHIEALAAQDDSPGFAQNHVFAIGTIKPGLLRSLAHTFALWAIKVIIVFDYRPGFVINMGTIHYARWWRVPGTNKTAFYSNFDGSWESYLEDFITRARWGQTAVWSNWKGFPPTKYLMFSGAEDGDRFKRWVRKQQQVVPFWYSRFPSLTTDQIRNNAMIHSGVAHARTNSEVAEWLRCFGSMPRLTNLIETDEVQGLVFSGMKRLKVSTCLVLKLPAGEALGEWLAWVRGETQTAPSFEQSQINALMKAGIILPVDGVNGGYCLSQSLSLTFGDRPLVGEGGVDDPALSPDGDQVLTRADAARMHRRAIFLGCSAVGVDKFDPKLTEKFSGAFRMGMAKRGRQMGDFGKQASDHWRWTDGSDGAEAVMFVYSETPEDLAYATEVHSSLIENFGGKVISQADCAPARRDAPPDQENIEHFGYRDGISQPVIKGSSRALKGVPARDLIEPGEFILGYASGQGFFPPSPLIGADRDVRGHLPTVEDGVMTRFPNFGAAQFADAPRDLGRNGSYVVIRELAQDVEGFEAFVDQKAKELRGACPASPGQTAYKDIYKIIGQHPDKDWVKAKLMGRWPNGRPLVGNPINMPLGSSVTAEQENDFAYGVDDPQGIACPFGAHIRRTNPRDSKQPGDPAEQIITNRHRLMRRGRPYVRPDKEKGLLFVALCSDLERQFEFVQQVWAASPSFHGLAHEPDPIIGGDLPDPDNAQGKVLERSYSIPTPAGPIKLTGMQSFVTVKAGGYFFLPSRSALAFLTDIALNQKPGRTDND